MNSLDFALALLAYLTYKAGHAIGYRRGLYGKRVGK